MWQTVNPVDRGTKITSNFKVGKPQWISEGLVGVGKVKGEGVVFDNKWAGVEISEIIKSFHGSSRSGLVGRTELNKETCLINFS